MAGQKPWGLRIVLVVLAVLVAVPVLGAIALAITFDPNRLKPRIVAAIHDATDRDVTIAGAIRLGLSLWPTLEVDDVNLANAPGFSPASMVSLDRLDFRLALLPLMHRHIEIEQLDLVHPVIALQIDAQGRQNWHFQRPPAQEQQPATPSTPMASRPTTLRIQTMSISDGAITLSDARTGALLAVGAVQLTATQGDVDGPIRLTVTGTDHAMPLTVTGDIGRPGNQFMPVDLTLNADGAHLTVTGTAPNFAIEGAIPDVAALSALAGRPLPSLHDISFRADLAPPLGGTYATGIVLSGLRLMAPTGDVTGDARITVAAPAAIRATLTSRHLDPAALIAAWPAPPPAAPAASSAPAPPPNSASQSASQPAVTPNLTISDRQLPFKILTGLDADVGLTMLDTKAGAATIKSATIRAVLHDGHFALDPVGIDLPGGHVDATAMADASGAVAIALRAPALSIQPLLSAFDQPDGVLGTVEVRLDLRGSGATPHALAAGLDGSFGLALANGEIDNRLLVALLAHIAPEAGLLGLAGKPGRSALRCLALRVDIAHGVGNVHALLLDTVPLRLTGGGTFDLGQESLALRLQPLARIGATGLSVPVNVVGSFRAPRIAIDAAAGRAMGGIVMGALGADRLIAGAGQSDGCAEQLQTARFGDPGPVPAALPAQEAAKPLPPNLNNLLKQLLR